jgi:hypothetical protein
MPRARKKKRRHKQRICEVGNDLVRGEYGVDDEGKNAQCDQDSIGKGEDHPKKMSTPHSRPAGRMFLELSRKNVH